MCGGGDDTSAEIARREEQRQAQIQKGLASINYAFQGFNPEFYNRLQSDYLATTLPQVGKQYRRAQSNLGFTLAGRGLRRSSVAQNLGASLLENLAENQRTVADQSRSATQEFQRSVEGQKRNLISQLQISADPQTAAQGALASAQSFESPSLVQPIGDLFRNWSNIYLARATNQTYAPPVVQNQRSSVSPVVVGNQIVKGT